jgi:hypothetical protein
LDEGDHLLDSFYKALDRYLAEVPPGTFKTSIADVIEKPRRDRSHIPHGAWPAMLTQREAAAYCGLDLPGFKRGVREGWLPAPVAGPIQNCRKRPLWSRAALDNSLAGLDAQSGNGGGSSVTQALEAYRNDLQNGASRKAKGRQVLLGAEPQTRDSRVPQQTARDQSL